jgi:serine/threonine protein kinase
MLAHGSYGVVINNTFKNYIQVQEIYTNNIINTNEPIASKLFLNNYQAFNDEIKNYQIISEIDINNNFTFKIIKTSKYKLLTKELKKLDFPINSNLSKNKFINIYEITMIKADISLIDYLKNNKNTLIFKKNFKKQFLNLLNGIKKLHDNKFVHLDLKETNILLYNDNLYLIDFGLSNNINELFFSNNIKLFGHSYVYFPFETKIIYDLYKSFEIKKYNNDFENNNSDSDYNNIKLEYEITNIKGIMKKIKKIDFIELYFDKYYENINTYKYDDKFLLINQVREYIDTLIKKNIILKNNKMDFKECMKYIFQDSINKIDIYSLGIILYNLIKFFPEPDIILNTIPNILHIIPDNRPNIDELIIMIKNSYV